MQETYEHPAEYIFRQGGAKINDEQAEKFDEVSEDVRCPRLGFRPLLDPLYRHGDMVYNILEKDIDQDLARVVES